MTHSDSRPPTALAEHAADHLAFIRETMLRAGKFTAVPGYGMMGVGTVGLAAALIAPRLAWPWQWLGAWLLAAVVAITLSFVAAARKAQRSGQSLRAGPARTFALAFGPSLVTGALLTIALVLSEHWELLPGTWLVCYGAAVVSGGAFSVRAVPVLGSVVIALGAITLFASTGAHPWLLGAGFGAAHLMFGFFIARYHGG